MNSARILKCLLLAVLLPQVALGEDRQNNQQSDVFAFDSIDPSAFDPRAMVKVVNALHSVGKEEAIKKLRNYAGKEDRRHDEVLRVLCVIKLLFEFPLEHRFSPDAVNGVFPKPSKFAVINWDEYPLIVRNGWPFSLVQIYVGAGGSEDALSYLDWAEKYGVLRAHRLHPTGSVVAVADELADHVKGSSLFNRDDICEALRHSFREQARLSLVRRFENATWSELQTMAKQLSVTE